MYDPTMPRWDSTIEERIANGRHYGQRRLMRLAGIVENYNSAEYAQSLGSDAPSKYTTRWWLVDPERPNDESQMSYVESDWCVLEDASGEGGMLW